MSLVMFCHINGYEFEVPTEDAVEKIVSVAAGSVESEELAKWISYQLTNYKSKKVCFRRRQSFYKLSYQIKNEKVKL